MYTLILTTLIFSGHATTIAIPDFSNLEQCTKAATAHKETVEKEQGGVAKVLIITSCAKMNER